MTTVTRIGLIGDRDETVVAHRAIPRALALAADAVDTRIDAKWVPTDEIEDSARIAGYGGLWCVPGSPYRSMEGALGAIQFAREQGRPFLGTCGGFQHAIVEFARSVLSWSDADHAESNPDARLPLIAPLACPLVETTETIRFVEGSRIAAAYGCRQATEGYHCRYGLNSAFLPKLVAGNLHVTAENTTGEVRAVELANHPFFVATLFQPERAALIDRLPPLVAAFVRAAANQRVR